MGREGSWRAPARPPVDHPGPPGRGSSARGASSQRGASGRAGRAGCGAPRRTATDGRRMKQLWAPWRLAFIEQVSHGSGCIFCEKPANHQDGKTFILWRGRHAFVLMNIYPYNNGHLLIATYTLLTAEMTADDPPDPRGHPHRAVDHLLFPEPPGRSGPALFRRDHAADAHL